MLSQPRLYMDSFQWHVTMTRCCRHEGWCSLSGEEMAAGAQQAAGVTARGLPVAALAGNLLHGREHVGRSSNGRSILAPKVRHPANN